jgi:hypothetical protein
MWVNQSVTYVGELYRRSFPLLLPLLFVKNKKYDGGLSGIVVKHFYTLLKLTYRFFLALFFQVLGLEPFKIPFIFD